MSIINPYDITRLLNKLEHSIFMTQNRLKAGCPLCMAIAEYKDITISWETWKRHITYAWDDHRFDLFK